MQDAMNAIKERLTGYNALKQESAGLLERLARMKAAAEFPAPAEPDGSQHTTGDGQRMARAIEDYVEYEERITPQLEKNRAEMLRIEQAVAQLPDPLEREVLRLRYLDGDSWRLPRWRDVAMVLYGDDDEKQIHGCIRLHKAALQGLSRFEW